MKELTTGEKIAAGVGMAIVFGLGGSAILSIGSIASHAEPKTIKKMAIIGLAIGAIGGFYYGYNSPASQEIKN
jgi:hypothetical protein